MHTDIQEILSRCGSKDSVLPPTEVYNEGWMLRLVLNLFDRQRGFHHQLAFEPEATWYSEALLPSRFLPTKRGDSLAESFTHADGVIGHFKVDSGLRGDASLLPRPSQFIVTEAKLGSSLSAGTKNAPSYDQAARNVSCMAHMLGTAAVQPSSVKRLAFYVLAPHSQIESGVFGELVTKPSIEAKVARRVADYKGKHDEWFESVFLPTLQQIELGILSWETVLAAIPDAQQRDALLEFYNRCLEFNPLRAASAP